MSDLQFSLNNLVRMNQAKSTTYAGYFIKNNFFRSFSIPSSSFPRLEECTKIFRDAFFLRKVRSQNRLFLRNGQIGLAK